ncbi:MAG: ribosome small subunit-dependent GTPase A [Candidatus Peregrinibacteria bacterium]
MSNEHEHLPAVSGEPNTGIISKRYGHDRYGMTCADGTIITVSAVHDLDLVVGDRVAFMSKKGGEKVIVEVYERKSEVRRVVGDTRKRLRKTTQELTIAANVDIGVIVTSVRQPKFQTRFVDRYLVVLQNGNVRPVLCLNKIDLERVKPSGLAMYQHLGLDIIETSVLLPEGLDDLRGAIHGRIAILIGHSGTGKTSLINTLLPEAHLRTCEVNVKTGSGKHTTSSTDMYRWEAESYIIDTPGIRSLGVGNIPKVQLKDLFPEFGEIAQKCRFNDCSHDHEPDCAVKTAVERGEIAISRYESYLRMLYE